MGYSAPEIMEMAVETERGGKSFYETVAAGTDDAKLKDLFGFLAKEEEKHIAAFQAIARTVKERPQDLAYNWQEAAQYLDAIVESRYFLGTGKALSLARESKIPRQALDHAIGFEKETLLFYTEVVEMVAEPTKPAVRKLIVEEKSHVMKLTTLRKILG
jgi:rubrerythrin